MAPTRDFKELVQKHVAEDPAFAESLLREGIDRFTELIRMRNLCRNSETFGLLKDRRSWSYSTR